DQNVRSRQHRHFRMTHFVRLATRHDKSKWSKRSGRQQVAKSLHSHAAIISCRWLGDYSSISTIFHNCVFALPLPVFWMIEPSLSTSITSPLDLLRSRRSAPVPSQLHRWLSFPSASPSGLSPYWMMMPPSSVEKPETSSTLPLLRLVSLRNLSLASIFHCR